MKNKKRLDRLLFEKGYFSSLNESYSSILSGKVAINNKLTDKPGLVFSENEVTDICISDGRKYASRGGLKLEKALREFSIQVTDKICMDAGCSTGGFTDCLFMNNAVKVYAIDVGYGAFDYKLRNDPRVILLERTNIRHLDKSLIRDKIDIITVDLSFISIKKVLDILISLCNEDYSIIQLVKPQFEANKEDLPRGGVVKSKELHYKIIEDLREYFLKSNLYIQNITFSPIKGPKGNIEFFVHLKNKKKELSAEYIRGIIDEAHQKLM